MVEEGGSTIWGHLPVIHYKSGKSGLGFTTGAQKVVHRAQAGGPPLRISNLGFNALEDSDGDSDIDSWLLLQPHSSSAGREKSCGAVS